MFILGMKNYGMYIVSLNVEKMQKEGNKWEYPAYAMAKIPLPHPPETTKLRKIQYHHFTKTWKNSWHDKNTLRLTENWQN